MIYTLNELRLPESAGVYVFGRIQRTGEFEALYVGRSDNIRGRVLGHLNSVRLMGHIESARKGKKVVRAGVFKSRSQKKITKYLPVIERALIHYFLSEGHDLANLQGARLGRHEVLSDGRHPNRFIPKLMLVG